MTTDEMERIAYCEGLPATAQLLARLADAEAKIETLEEGLQHLKDMAACGLDSIEDFMDGLNEIYLTAGIS